MTGEPRYGELAGLVEGTLTGPARAAIEAHVAGCARCRRLVGAVRTIDARLAEARRSSPRLPRAVAILERARPS
jgi:anti-sigma factor RsiW